MTSLYTERLPALEAHCGMCFGRRIIPADALRPNVDTVWRQLILDAGENLVSYKKRYLFELLKSLIHGTGTEIAGESYENADPWHDFVDFIRVEAPNHVDGMLLGATYWHDAFDGASLTLGWLLLNAIRVQHGLAPLDLAFSELEIRNCLRDFSENDGSLFRIHLYDLMSENEEFPDY